MKDSITHVKCQRAKRPREQHLKLDVRHVDEIVKGVEALQLQQFKLEEDNRKLREQLAAK